MRPAASIACVIALVVCARVIVSAQTRVMAGEHRTVHASVEMVDRAGRRITLRGSGGELRTVHVPNHVNRLSKVKPGDTVTATYYDNIVVRVKPVDESDVDAHASGATGGEGARPAGTIASPQTITAVIDDIDLREGSISLTGPRGWSYRSRVQDRQALREVHIGDRVDVTWTEATLVSVAPAKK
jgi:hypothetical protein